MSENPDDPVQPKKPADTRDCPLCGEEIKKVAVRCKHCHADLAAAPMADFDRAAPVPAAVAAAVADPSSDLHAFEQRFLDFAYVTDEPLTAISVAHALKVPISVADDRLEALAASDVIHRDVDSEGGIYFTLPGRRGRPSHGQALVPFGPAAGNRINVHLVGGSLSPTPTEAAAVTGLVLNLCMPGVGSIVAGKPGPGIAQLAMVIIGLPLCFLFVGFPMIFAAWVWSLMTATQALNEAKLAQQQQ